MVEVNKLREIAKEVVSRDDVRVLIGYRPGTYGFRARPAFVEDPGEVDQLIFTPACVNNLATYITPTLAEEAEYPRRFMLSALAGLFLLLGWSIGALVYYSVRDRS